MDVSPLWAYSSGIQLSELVPNVRIPVICLSVSWFMCRQGCSGVIFAEILV